MALTPELERELKTLRRQHHALLPPYLLHIPSAASLIQPAAQEYLVNEVLHDKAIELVKPERGYEKTFWRRIVNVIEDGLREIQNDDPSSEVDIDERIYEALAEFMVSDQAATNDLTISCPAQHSSMPKQSYRTFIYDKPTTLNDPVSQASEGRVTLLEEQVAIQAGTTGLRTWYVSAVLNMLTSLGQRAHHILLHPEILLPPPSSSSNPFQWPPCVELGSGTGFLSILMAQLGADIISTDLDDGEGERQTPLGRLQVNAGLSARTVELERSRADVPLFMLDPSATSIRIEALDWADALLDPEDRPSLWRELTAQSVNRTIVAADVIYDPDIVPLLVSTIDVLLSPSNIAIISATVRNPTTLELFEAQCVDKGLTVESLDLAPMDRNNPTFWDSALDHGSEVRIMRVSKPKPM